MKKFFTLEYWQIKRTAALAETLARKFDIPSRQIIYPANWQL